MKNRYNREDDILTLELSEATIDHAEETGPIVIHFSADDRLVMLEVVEASDLFAKLTKAAVRAEDEMAAEV
jgi:Protein of unknown function (DUF2283)